MAKTSDAAEWADATGVAQVLLRSHIEIAKLLNAAIDAELPVVACLREGEGLFVSRLLGLSADDSHVLMAYGDHKAANGEILTAGSATLGFNYKNSYIEFRAEHAVEDFSAGAAIRFDFPSALFIKQRRSHQRIVLIPGIPLSCLADSAGVMPFTAQIIDIGIGGLGVMVYAKNIQLEPGTLLRDCKITLPGQSLATVDISIRHTEETLLTDGSSAHRAGCSFAGPPEVIQSLLKIFLLDLERKEGETDASGS